MLPYAGLPVDFAFTFAFTLLSAAVRPRQEAARRTRRSQELAGGVA